MILLTFDKLLVCGFSLTLFCSFVSLTRAHNICICDVVCNLRLFTYTNKYREPYNVKMTKATRQQVLYSIDDPIPIV